jgi:hypothetical protein
LVRSFKVNFGGALFAAGFEEVLWEFEGPPELF